MSTFYRVASGPDSANEVISYLTTDTQGIKIKDSFDISSTSELTLGVDASLRNWDGTYEGKGSNAMITGNKSIDDVDTENTGLFAEIENSYSNVSIKAGIRFDDTSITPAGSLGQQSNDYTGVGANIFTNFRADANTSYFAGVGTASRVPDARELYFYKPNMDEIGTPTLEKTTNTQVDLGLEKTYSRFNVRAKVFYSWLGDYIYYNADKTTNAFENIDATIYGFDVSGAYFASDEVYVDFGLAYQRGKKDEALAGQTDTDLAEVPPMKANIALNYDYSNRNTASISLVAADAWDNYDSDNGEQYISGYGIVNIKVRHYVTQSLELTAGIDNITDKTYAVTNTYKDLTLLVAGSADVILMNEPGRYLYVNGTYRF
jgi:iron complex outermembrane receptor protein